MSFPQHIINILGGDPIAYDDFNRIVPVNGEALPTGQVYRVNYVDNIQNIVRGRYISNPDPAAARIAYVDLTNPIETVVGEFVFPDIKTGITNTNKTHAVIGSCNTGFGLGSIQLAVYPDLWRLFVVENPIVDPYPILASGSYSTPLEENKLYRMYMTHDPVTSSVTLTVPKANPVTVSDPRINTYWGNVAGMQVRVVAAASGSCEFDLFAVK